MSNVLRFPSAADSVQNDDDAREEALNIRSSCIVEAPAGSGKTGLLVQRYLKLLADESVSLPEEVLAVTFTRKATAELRERVLAQLERAKTGAALPEDAPLFERTSFELATAALERSTKLGWELLEQPLRLNIKTFDSVSAEIANALPLIAGSGGPREPVEDAQPLYQQAARRTLMQLGGRDRALDAALRTVLLHRDGNLRDCESLIVQMLQQREQWGELVPLSSVLDDALLGSEVRPRLERALEAIVAHGLERAVDLLPSGALEFLTAFAQRMAGEPGYNGAPSPISFCFDKHEPPQAVASCLEHWATLIKLVIKESDREWRKSFNANHVYFEMPKNDRAGLKQFVQEIESERLRLALGAVLDLPPARYPEEQWRVAKALFRVLRHALIELKLLFAEQGECDFAELALAAREVLRSEATTPELALAAGGRLRHMLIDEMQDTSAGQYELIQLLTQSWDGQSQTLFLVGDPKQSIYLFRAARVERFLRTMSEAQLGDIPLDALRLTANFRSQVALIEEPGGFNDAFSRLFDPPEAVQTPDAFEAVDVPFVAAVAKREKTQPKGVVWHTAVLGEEELEEGEDHRQHEAREIRRIIEERLALPLPAGRTKPWRVAVLGHGRRHLAAVVEEFKITRVPEGTKDPAKSLAFKAIDLDPLDARPEVLDVLALTRALLHPADRTAWLAVLRAPWCGLGRADLLALTGDGVEQSATVSTLVAEHRQRLSKEGQALLARAWPVLEMAVATLGRSPLATHVERTWRSLGGDAMLTLEQRENVLCALGVLREVESDGGRVDLEVFAARLRSLYAESAATADVELLTIHKAKGLEWDLVLVPGLERKTGQSRHLLLNWLEFDTEQADEAAVILAPISSRGTPAGKLSDWLSGLRRRREESEHKRLFYVAVTRAQEELHLFAASKRKKDGSLAQPAAGSLLSASWNAAAGHFGAVAASPATSKSDAAEDENSFDELALAAGAETTERQHVPSLLRRLPSTFDPAARFAVAAEHRLPYVPAASLPRTGAFDRPEGSFAVRAFGNVVHRYLQRIADRLALESPALLAAEASTWRPRLETSLRGEGLPPRDAAREAPRALEALEKAIADPIGRWILSPHISAASESSLTTSDPVLRGLRIDRTFRAGFEPGAGGDSQGGQAIWLIDFKTTEQGSLSDAVFEEQQRSRYAAQLESYAAIRRQMPDSALPIRLGLYFPLLPKLLYWSSEV